MNTQSKCCLQHEDWLVTRGIYAIDNFFATMTNKPLSHAAIYDAEHDEVVGAKSVGVLDAALTDFLAKSHRVMVVDGCAPSVEDDAMNV